MRTKLLSIAILLALSACSMAAQDSGRVVPANAERGTPAPMPPEPGTVGGLPKEVTPLPEPKGPIDPKSAEAAGQVVQHYAALTEQKRFAEAEALWGDGPTAKQFDDAFRDASEIHWQVGRPTDPEGAAGSIFITVPVVLYGRQADGGSLQRSGEATLRRVNDVDGSTAAQRRWHIERIAWGDAQ